VSKRFGMDVKRVSPKNRNPAGVPDAREAGAQAGLEKRLAAGEMPGTLDAWQVVTAPTGKVFRYARASPAQPLCLSWRPGRDGRGREGTACRGLSARQGHWLFGRHGARHHPHQPPALTTT